MKTTRKYTMGARAQAVEQTRSRILHTTIALAGERPFADITLDAVAELAGVSVQTILRQFGSRDGLVAAGAELATAEIIEERRTPAGDVPAAMRSLADHYEQLGRTALLMLAQEGHDDLARQVTDRGKAMHRQWVTEAFAPATADERVLDLLVVATDVYTWKLMRIDRGHTRAVTERRMHDLVDAVLASTSTSTSKET
jgi:AcrR family transcriptional regulator